MSTVDMTKRKVIKDAIIKRLDEHEGCFGGVNVPLLKISNTYPGLWMEHIYDSVFYATLNKDKLYLAENAILSFIERQTPEGQLPYIIKDAIVPSEEVGYDQVQECVSFGSLALMVYRMNGNKEFLKVVYPALIKWVGWLKKYRMTRGTGLIEMFCGFDTGHDNSARVLDLGSPRKITVGGEKMTASTPPESDGISPVIALDMSCNYYGNLRAIEQISLIMGYPCEEFAHDAQNVKKKIFELLYDGEDGFFYDLDIKGNKRKILSCSVLHLFIEGVLDPNEDKKIIDTLTKKYIFNEKHFMTPYPFPAVSVSDPSWKKHTPSNCWGYFTQSLTVLRTTLWMERYGFNKEFDHMCKRFLGAWENCYGELKFGQELDPITGKPSECSEWYSSCMLMCLYCILKEESETKSV